MPALSQSSGCRLDRDDQAIADPAAEPSARPSRAFGRSVVPPHAGLAFAGSVLMPYGQPEPPKGRPIVARGLDEATLRTTGADYLITHEHSLYFSSLDDAALARLAPRLRLLAEFDPAASEDAELAVFEETDAYYIPVHGFDRVQRPGPLVRIYRFEPRR